MEKRDEESERGGGRTRRKINIPREGGCTGCLAPARTSEKTTNGKPAKLCFLDSNGRRGKARQLPEEVAIAPDRRHCAARTIDRNLIGLVTA